MNSHFLDYVLTECVDDPRNRNVPSADSKTKTTICCFSTRIHLAILGNWQTNKYIHSTM